MYNLLCLNYITTLYKWFLCFGSLSFKVGEEILGHVPVHHNVSTYYGLLSNSKWLLENINWISLLKVGGYTKVHCQACTQGVQGGSTEPPIFVVSN